MVGRSPVAARQLASRARRRVKGADIRKVDDLPSQRRVVDAFFRAAHGGDFEGLVAVLDPNVVLRGDAGGKQLVVVRGPAEVAKRAHGVPGTIVHPALVDGRAGVVITREGRPFVVMGFTVVGGRIVEIEAIANPERVARITAGFVAG